MPRQGKAKVLNKQEFHRLLVMVKNSHFAERNLAMVYLSFACGLRVKEIAALNISDVIDQHYQLLDELNLLRHMTKGNKQRMVYLEEDKLCEALSAWLKIRLQQNPQRDAPLFITQKKQRFTPNALQHTFAALYRKAGIIGASSHTGRRTFATNLLENGADIRAVQRLMGHASIQMTAEYVEDNPARLKKMVKLAMF